MTEEEANGFDLEKLIGVNCTLQIIHNRKDDAVYANVKTIVPAMKNSKKLAVTDYVREAQRTDGPGATDSSGSDDEECPF
jgi:hypothetical protein